MHYWATTRKTRNSGLATWTSQIDRQSVRQGGRKGCDCSEISTQASNPQSEQAQWIKRAIYAGKRTTSKQHDRQSGRKGCDFFAMISTRTAGQKSGWSEQGVWRARHRKACSVPIAATPWGRELTPPLQIQRNQRTATTRRPKDPASHSALAVWWRRKVRNCASGKATTLTPATTDRSVELDAPNLHLDQATRTQADEGASSAGGDPRVMKYTGEWTRVDTGWRAGYPPIEAAA